VLDLRATERGMRAELERFARILVISVFTEEDDRRELRARGKVLQPFDAATAGPDVREQHGIEPLREKFRSGSSMQNGTGHDELGVGPAAREMVPDERAITRVVFEHQQPHAAVAPREKSKIVSRGLRHRPARA
jgi:hypothetical protein